VRLSIYIVGSIPRTPRPPQAKNANGGRRAEHAAWEVGTTVAISKDDRAQGWEECVYSRMDQPQVVTLELKSSTQRVVETRLLRQLVLDTSMYNRRTQELPGRWRKVRKIASRCSSHA